MSGTLSPESFHLFLETVSWICQSRVFILSYNLNPTLLLAPFFFRDHWSKGIMRPDMPQLKLGYIR